MTRAVLILKALKDGPMDTDAIAKATGILRPGSALSVLEIERKVKRIGTRPAGKRPWIVWQRVG